FRRHHPVAAMRKHRLLPVPLRAESHASVDADAAAVVRTTINVAHGLNLAGSEAVIAIRSGRTHPVPEIHSGIEVAAWRIVDDAVADAVVGVALRQDRVAQDLPFGEAFGYAVAVLVEGEVAREIIGEDPLRHPYVRDVEPLIVENGSAGHDAVEITRVALGLHQTLTPARRAAFEIGVGSRTAVEVLHERFGGDGRQMDGTMTEIDHRIEVIVRE